MKNSLLIFRKWSVHNFLNHQNNNIEQGHPTNIIVLKPSFISLLIKLKVGRRMTIASIIGSKNALFLQLQGVVILTITALLITTLILRGRENRLWKVTLCLFVICILPFILGQILPVEIKVDESKTIVNEPFDVEVTIKNPYPIPVWYYGCEWIYLDKYPSGTFKAQDEDFAVNTVAGGKLGSGIILPWRDYTIYSRRFIHNETEKIDIVLMMKVEAGIIEKSRTIDVIDKNVITSGYGEDG